MTAAFRATFSDMKLVKTRQVAQLIFEIPIEDFDAAYEVLGGMPVPSKERWFAVAALRTPQEEAAESRQDQTHPQDDDSDGERRIWKDVQPSAQAAMRCDQPKFWAFLREEHKQRVTSKEDAATSVRQITGVNSRARFNDNHTARVAWHQLDTQFSVWLAKERVGA